MAIVTVDELTDYMSEIEFTNRQERAAQFVLDGLHAELESFLRRPIEVTAYVDEEYRIPFDAQGIPSNSIFYNSDIDTTGTGMSYAYSPPYTLVLKNSPVVSVSSVKRVTPTSGYTEAVAAQGVLTLDTNPTDGDTMTVGTKTYLFQDTLTNTDGNIQIGGTLSETQDHIVKAFSLTGTAGVEYAASMSEHPTVGIGSFVSDQATLTAKTAGAAGNSIATTETFIADTNVFDGATLGTATAGSDGVVVGEELTPNVDYIVHNYGIDLYEFGPSDLIQVSYSAGLDGANIKTLKLLILRAAAREVQNTHDDAISIKDLTGRDVALKETGFLESELNGIKRWRRVRVS